MVCFPAVALSAPGGLALSIALSLRTAAFCPRTTSFEITPYHRRRAQLSLAALPRPRKASRASPPVLIVRLNFCWLTESRYCTPLRWSTLSPMSVGEVRPVEAVVAVMLCLCLRRPNRSRPNVGGCHAGPKRQEW
jgi:hypothetical protein